MINTNKIRSEYESPISNNWDSRDKARKIIFKLCEEYDRLERVMFSTNKSWRALADENNKLLDELEKLR